MYINPFWLGVASTLLCEVAALIIYAIIWSRKKGGRK